jgi:hypothetical protein
MSPSPRPCLIVLAILVHAHAASGADGAGLDALAADTLLRLEERAEAGEALTPQYVDLMCTWTRRKGAAAIRKESYTPQRLGAALVSLRDSENVYRLIHSIFHDEMLQSQQAMTEHRLREAGAWLARPDDAPAEDDGLPESLPAYDPRAPDLRECADRAARALRERVDAGEALTPTVVSLQATWYRRLARAAVTSLRDPEQRVRVARDHLDRVRELVQLLEWVHPVEGPPTHARAEATCFVREAELWVAQAQAAAAPAGKAPQDDRAEAAAREALVESATVAWRESKKRADAGEAMTPTFVELLCQSSRRLCRAEQLARPAKDARVKSAQEHLDRMKPLHDTLDQRFKAGVDVSAVQVAQAMYFLREAELWVAQSSAE